MHLYETLGPKCSQPIKQNQISYYLLFFGDFCVILLYFVFTYGLLFPV